MKIYISCFLCALLFCGCISKEKKHLNEALSIIENKSIRIDSIDWLNIKHASYEALEKSKNIGDVNLIIKNVLTQLNDRHSMFWESDKVVGIQSNVESSEIFYEIISDSIGYIEVPSFSGFEEIAKVYSKNIQKGIKELDSSNVKYWIIDIRNNTGGNMWPMLGGLSPFLKNDILGYVLDRDHKFSPWYTNSNAVYSNNEKRFELNHTHELANSWKKIAILIGEKTASSAEALAISFKGIDNVKLFGEPTYGVSTANTSYELADGSLLILTTHIMADRNKKLYGNKITPDVYTENPKEDAIKWFLNKE